jgi:hypothetical protein
MKIIQQYSTKIYFLITKFFKVIFHYMRYYGLYYYIFKIDKRLNFTNFFTKENFFFDKEIKNSKFYLEFGSGASTFHAKRLKKKFYSIESDKAFFSQISKEIGKNLILKELGVVGFYSTPLNFQKNKYKLVQKAIKYTDDVLRFLIKKGEIPDLVLIDGRYRVSTGFALHRFYSKKNKKFCIIFDDYKERRHYHILSRFFKIEIVGRFGVARNLIQNITIPDSLLRKYLLDYR